MKRIGMTLMLAGLAWSAAAQAATAEDDNPNRVVLSGGSTISAAVEGMAKAAGATVAVDPALTGRVSAATAKLPLEPGLTAIAKLHRARWLKLYLDDAQVPRGRDGAPDARRLKALVEATQSAPAQTIGVVDPGTGQMTVTTRAPEKSPAMLAWAKDRKPIYLLYLPTPEPAARAEAGGMMPPGGLDEFRKMTPEQRRQWMDQHGGTIISSDMSPEERESLLQRLPPEERERIRSRMQGGGDQVMIWRREERTAQP